MVREDVWRSATHWGEPNKAVNVTFDNLGSLGEFIAAIVTLGYLAFQIRANSTLMAAESRRARATQTSGKRKVILLYGAANRDEKVFEDPECFDVSRSPNPHLGYGDQGRTSVSGRVLPSARSA